jgi:excisionase family DNA binding protein
MCNARMAQKTGGLRNKMAEQEWFTVAEAAEYLRLSKPSIYRLVSQGVLTAHTIGGKGERRFKRADLNAALRREPKKTGRLKRPGGQ